MIKKENNNMTDSSQNSADEINLKLFFKPLLRNKLLIGTISFIFFLVGCSVSLTFKRVWQGEFQIVVSEKKSQQFPSIDPNISSLLRGGAPKNDLQTQVGILNSPSVLMPIFEYVYDQKKLKAINSNISFYHKIDFHNKET